MIFLKPEEAAWCLLQVGWTPGDAKIMVAIGMAATNLRVDSTTLVDAVHGLYKSGWLPLLHSDIASLGGPYDVSDVLQDPVLTARIALSLYNNPPAGYTDNSLRYWGDWYGYDYVPGPGESGPEVHTHPYEQWLAAAEVAVASPVPYANLAAIDRFHRPQFSAGPVSTTLPVDVTVRSVRRRYTAYLDLLSTTPYTFLNDMLTGEWIYAPGAVAGLRSDYGVPLTSAVSEGSVTLSATKSNTTAGSYDATGDGVGQMLFDCGNGFYWRGQVMLYAPQDPKDPRKYDADAKALSKGYAVLGDGSSLPPRPQIVVDPTHGITVDSMLDPTKPAMGVSTPVPLASATPEDVWNWLTWFTLDNADPKKSASISLTFHPVGRSDTGEYPAEAKLVSWGTAPNRATDSGYRAQQVDLTLTSKGQKPAVGRAWDETTWRATVSPAFTDTADQSFFTYNDLDNYSFKRFFDVNSAPSTTLLRTPGGALTSPLPEFDLKGLDQDVTVGVSFYGTGAFATPITWTRSASPEPVWINGDLPVEIAKAASDGLGPDTVYYPAAVVALNGLTLASSIDELVAACALMLSDYGLRLQVPTTKVYDGFACEPISRADLEQARLWMRGILTGLAHYPPSYVVGLQLDTIVLVGDISGTTQPGMSVVAFSNHTKIMYFGCHRIENLVQGVHTLHHELMHIAQASDEVYWDAAQPAWTAANPKGFSYTGKAGTTANDMPTGFASNYGQTNYAEDIAEVMTLLWEPGGVIYTRLANDPGLLTKVEIMVKWLNTRGLTTFNEATGLLVDVTLRLPDGAPAINRFAFRFGDGGADVRGDNTAALNPDARSLTRALLPGTYQAVALGVSEDNKDYLYSATYTVAPQPKPAPPDVPRGLLNASLGETLVSFT